MCGNKERVDDAVSDEDDGFRRVGLERPRYSLKETPPSFRRTFLTKSPLGRPLEKRFDRPLVAAGVIKVRLTGAVEFIQAGSAPGGQA